MKFAKSLLVVLAFASLCACGGGGGSSGGSSSQDGGNPTPPSTETSVPTPGTAEPEVSTPVVSSGESTTAAFLSLSWTIPAARENGDYLPVYEIAGYELRYSKDQGTAVTVIRINDPQKTDLILENVQRGLYEFSIATIDSEGVYSDFSSQTTVRVQ